MRDIAVRTFRVTDLDGLEGPVVLTIEEPYPVDGGAAFFCQIRIEGLGVDWHRPVGGQDAVQALLLAFNVAGAFLYASPEFRAGKLKWLTDEGDLGLPRPGGG